MGEVVLGQARREAAVEGDDHVEHARLQREPGLGRLDTHGTTVVGVRHAADEPRRFELVQVTGERRPLDADRTRELLDALEANVRDEG